MTENKKRTKTKPVHTAEEFGLDIFTGEDDLFRWFLLCYLLGKPIQSTVAVQTWRLFIDEKLDTPWAIRDTSERRLIRLLEEGKYTRYSNVMARSLHICMDQLIRGYDGSLLFMYEYSETEEQLSKRLQELHGIGPKTAEIFMREVSELFARRVE